MGPPRYLHSRDYNSWYGLPSYQRRRRHHLQENPLCKSCMDKGLVVPATVADHVVPHRGDFNSFMLGPLQSYCDSCHSSQKRVEELRGYRTEVGRDGLPLDPRHPTYRHDLRHRK